jgi:CheY-like chemotaxis protein
MARILIIDDDRDTRNLFQAKLEAAGFECTVAADGETGIAAYRDAPSDVVITDIFMPGMEGLELIRAFKRKFPDARVIAISAGGPEQLNGLQPLDYLELAKKMGARDVFKKPVDFESLISTLHELTGSTGTR